MKNKGGLIRRMREQLIQKGDCLEYTGHYDELGYPKTTYQDNTHVVYRLLYQLYVDKLQPRQVVKQSCGNSRCCKPEHLYNGISDVVSKDSILENVRLGLKRNGKCLEWIGRYKDGFPVVKYRDGDTNVCRLIYGLYVEKIGRNRQIEHLCLNEKCCKPEHLIASLISDIRKNHSIIEFIKDNIKIVTCQYPYLSDCWEWQGFCDEDGYGRTSCDYKNPHIHRTMWIETFGEIKDNLLVLHKCDNRKCVNTDHLELGTDADNNKHKKERKRCADFRGEKSGMAKLQNIDIPVIRQLSKEGWKRTDLAKKFKVGLSTIDNVLTGKTWKHI